MTPWLALHGAGRTHDRVVNRGGACEECRTGVERAPSMGLRCGCVGYLTLPRATLGAQLRIHNEDH